MIHQNSVLSFQQSRKVFSKRARMVLEWLKNNGPATDEQVAQGLGFWHKSYVQPRITELVQLGAAVEVGHALSPNTKKIVRKVAAA